MVKKRKCSRADIIRRNKYLFATSEDVFADMNKHEYYGGIFEEVDHFMISMFERLYLYSSKLQLDEYEYQEKETWDIKFRDLDLHIWGIDIFKPEHFLEDCTHTVDLSPEYKDVDCFRKMVLDKNPPQNGPTSKMFSFIEMAQKKDIVIRYGVNHNHDPLFGRGYYILIRKIKGRFEVINKFKWYIS